MPAQDFNPWSGSRTPASWQAEEAANGLASARAMWDNSPNPGYPDTDNLQSVAGRYARAMRIPPDRIPTVTALEHVPGSMGESTPESGLLAIPDEGPPFLSIEKQNPAGHILVAPQSGKNADLSYMMTLKHEMSHQKYREAMQMAPYEMPAEARTYPKYHGVSDSTPGIVFDETHGPRGGAAFYGNSIGGYDSPVDSPYYRDAETDNPWSTQRAARHK